MTARDDGPLRIAVVHSFYSSRQPSGENVVVDLQVGALRRAGHDVALVSRSTDELEAARSYPLRAGFRAATGLGDSALREVEAHRPDVVHVHNLFPNLGRRWVTQLRAPVVSTLHNFRPICPAATLLRDGHSCTLCPDTGRAHHAVVHRCFKGSLAQTVPVAIGTRFADDPVLRSSARLVVLSELMRGTYEAYGVEPDRLVTIPNFVAPSPRREESRDERWLYVGRLSEEKGILALLEAWPDDRQLLVVGAGPSAEQARSLAGSNVTFLGQRPAEDVARLMASSRGLVFPSLWPEGLPTVYLEALAAGLPVVAWPDSIVGSLVAREGTGLVADKSSLTARLDEADSLFPTLGEHCRSVFAASYSEDAWVSAIDAVYRSVLRR